MRLDYLLQSDAASRGERLPLKKAQQRIRGGGLCVDGLVLKDPKHQVLLGVESVTDTVSGAGVGADHVFCLLNKPAGCVSQRHPTEPNVYDLIPPELQRQDLVAFGRLDKDTTGMLLFGTDGGVQSLLLSPTSRVWKTYTAHLEAGSSNLEPDAAATFAAGVVLDDGVSCQPATLEVIDADSVRVTLHEGFFHQVKRMLSHVGGHVVGLHRDRFGQLADPNLALGRIRRLTGAELRSLVDMLPADRTGNRPVEGRRPVAAAIEGADPPAGGDAMTRAEARCSTPADVNAHQEEAKAESAATLKKRGREGSQDCLT